MATWVDPYTGDIYEYDDGGSYSEGDWMPSDGMYADNSYTDDYSWLPQYYDDWGTGSTASGDMAGSSPFVPSGEYSSPGGMDWLGGLSRFLFGSGGASSALGAGSTGGLLGSITTPQALTTGLGALLGGMSGSKQTGTQTVTQEPWSGQQPYLSDLFGRAQGAVDQAMARPSDYELNATAKMNQFIQNQDATNPYFGQNNPHLQQQIDYANQDVMRGIQPMMNAANRASGSFGNSGVAETFGRTASDAMARNANSMRMQDYGLQAQLGENAVNRTMTGAQNVFNMGNQQRMSAFEPLKQYGSLITGNYGSQQSSPIYSNPLSGALGGGLLGGQLYKMLNGG